MGGEETASPPTRSTVSTLQGSSQTLANCLDGIPMTPVTWGKGQGQGEPHCGKTAQPLTAGGPRPSPGMGLGGKIENINLAAGLQQRVAPGSTEGADEVS